MGKEDGSVDSDSWLKKTQEDFDPADNSITFGANEGFTDGLSNDKSIDENGNPIDPHINETHSQVEDPNKVPNESKEVKEGMIEPLPDKVLPKNHTGDHVKEKSIAQDMLDSIGKDYIPNADIVIPGGTHTRTTRTKANSITQTKERPETAAARSVVSTEAAFKLARLEDVEANKLVIDNSMAKLKARKAEIEEGAKLDANNQKLKLSSKLKVDLQDNFNDLSDALSEPIDPNRWWNNKTQYQQNMMNIGKVMDAFAYGFSGGKLQMTVDKQINTMVERDIKAQLVDIQNKKTLYTAKTGLIKQLYIESEGQIDIRKAVKISKKLLKEKIQSDIITQERLKRANKLAGEQAVRESDTKIKIAEMNYRAERGQDAKVTTADNVVTQKIPYAARVIRARPKLSIDKMEGKFVEGAINRSGTWKKTHHGLQTVVRGMPKLLSKYGSTWGRVLNNLHDKAFVDNLSTAEVAAFDTLLRSHAGVMHKYFGGAVTDSEAKRLKTSNIGTMYIKNFAEIYKSRIKEDISGGYKRIEDVEAMLRFAKSSGRQLTSNHVRYVMAELKSFESMSSSASILHYNQGDYGKISKRIRSLLPGHK